MTETKTNAMRLFDAAKIDYKIHTYDTEDGLLDGNSVAEKCGQDPNRVFKTLVTKG
ncbi:MAG TPA: Cys-tRNA(Pro) deacylase, partial [Clostridium sp.]|nr:Cys-tRNA(Pro) deacylase [Clostridium sp.]